MKSLLKSFIWISISVGFCAKSLAQNNIILLKTERKQDNSVEIHYEKFVPGNYTIAVKFSNLTNSYNSDFEEVVNSTSGKLMTLNPIDKKLGINFMYSYTYTKGIINPKFDSLFVYTLPFQEGKIINIYETSNLFHDILDRELPKNWKAYQFNTVNADTIFAARKGIVVAVVDHNVIDTISLLTTKRNYLTIEHVDGTFATYAGFAHKKMLVKLGQTIYPRTPIGIVKESFRAVPNNFSFMVYYLNKEKPKRNSKESGDALEIRNAFITPYFFTDKGTIQLKDFEKYQVAVSPDLLLKELTKSERKKMNLLK